MSIFEINLREYRYLNIGIVCEIEYGRSVMTKHDSYYYKTNMRRNSCRWDGILP